MARNGFNTQAFGNQTTPNLSHYVEFFQTSVLKTTVISPLKLRKPNLKTVIPEHLKS